MVAMNKVSALSCLSILLLAATTAIAISGAHSPETPLDALFPTFQVQTLLTQLSYTSMRSGPSLSARIYTASKFQPTLKFTQCSMGDGAQQRCGQPEREACELEKREMEAPRGFGGKLMRTRGNGGSNLGWRRNKFPLWPTCYVNFEFLRPIMIPSSPFMSLNFGTFPWFCTVV